MSSIDFVDDFPKDPLIGGDGHIDGIKAHFYYDYFSIELWSTFYIHDTVFNQKKFNLAVWTLKFIR